MKFLYTSLLLISLVCTPAVADYTPGITSEPCGNGTGHIVIGNNGKSYCRGRRSFNWWSAMSWCQSIGMELISINEDCICAGEKCPQAQCPNFSLTNWGFAWTSNVDKNNRTLVITGGGGVSSDGGYGNPAGAILAVCRMP